MPPKVTRQTPTQKKTTTKANPTGFEARLVPIGFNKDDPIKLLLFGKSGTGKTTLAGTFPKPTLWLTCSGAGRNPGELRSLDTPANRGKIVEFCVETTQDMLEAVEFCNSSGNKFKSVAVDHVTGLSDVILRDILGVDKVPEQKSWGLASQQQWGQVSLQMKELLRGVISSTMNVIIIAHERTFKPQETDDTEDLTFDEDLMNPYVAAAVTPAVAGWINGACDYVCQTYIRNKMRATVTDVAGTKITTQARTKEVEYCLRTLPSPLYAGKFRVPKGTTKPDCIVDPSYDKIVKLIHGE